LRDANWDPDFPTAAKKIEWFMSKGGIADIDGTIATNLIAFEEVLKVLGPISLPDYQEVVTSENLWLLGERYAQEEFFPGSIQKKEFFSDLARESLRVFNRSSPKTKLRLFLSVFRLLGEKQIMISLHDRRAQSAFDSLHWSGRLESPPCPWLRPCVPFSLMIVEANLGVNKANCCITREATLEIMPEDTGIHHTLSVAWTNSSSKDRWGGRYKAWVRIYANTKEQTGFWIEVPENETKAYRVTYNLPNLTSRPDSPIFLFVQKQSGIDEYPLTIKIEKRGRDREKTKEIQVVIRADRLFVL
jgi:hypothetical protein